MANVNVNINVTVEKREREKEKEMPGCEKRVFREASVGWGMFWRKERDSAAAAFLYRHIRGGVDVSVLYLVMKPR